MKKLWALFGLLPILVFADVKSPPAANGGSIPAGSIPLSALQTQPPGTELCVPVGAGSAQSPSACITNITYVQADATGVADAAPAFRAAIASNTKVVIPPGTYLFKSTQTPPCCANDNAAVLVQSFHDFEIDGYGATIVIDPTIALSSAFHFDQDKNFTVNGLTIQGSRSGLTSGQENVGITVTSGVGFAMRDLHFSGNFGGIGTGLAGDWLVNSWFTNIRMDAAGQCFDFAFLKNVTFDGIVAYGVGTDGSTGTGGKCMSIVNDTANSATNNTGVSYTATQGVVIKNNIESNFNTGAYVTTGTDYTFNSNYWYNNPGVTSGSVKGLGIYISYVNGGAFTSVSVPPGNVSIIGDKFTNNGTTVAGYGVLLDSSAIANSDVISGISIDGSIFNNNTATGIGSIQTAGLSAITVGLGNSFTGSNQTTSIDSNTKSLNNALASPPAIGAVTPGPITGTTFIGTFYDCIAGNCLLYGGNTIISGVGANSFQVGPQNGTSPASQTVSTQGALAGTASNTAGGSLTIQSGLGTGTGTASVLNLKVPATTTSGTGQQTAYTELSLSSTANSIGDTTNNPTFSLLGTGAISFGGTTTLPSLILSGGISAPFSNTGGGPITVAASTQTDSTTAAGTVTSVYSNNIAQPTFATASNAITISNAYTWNIAGCPLAGAHVTIGTCGAIRTGSGGFVNFQGGATINGGAINLNAGSSNVVNIGTGGDTAAVNIGGGSNTVTLQSTGGGTASKYVCVDSSNNVVIQTAAC